MPRLLALVFLVLVWGACSAVTDNLNRYLLLRIPLPVTLTLLQFGISACCGYLLLPVLGKRPSAALASVTFSQSLPLIISQALGFLATNVSFGLSSVSLTHTIKAAAPLFSLVLARIFTPDNLPVFWLYVSIIPIVLGVQVTARTDLTFDKWGFAAAMASNLCFALRAILSKNLAKMDEFSLYYLVSVRSFIVTLPIWVVFEGPAVVTAIRDGSWTGHLQSSEMWGALLACCVFHFLYNQISFVVLSFVTPLTHGVLNVVRRMVVIAASFVMSRTLPSTEMAAGIGMVFGGAGLYFAADKARKASAERTSKRTA